MTEDVDRTNPFYFSTSREIPGLRVQDLEYEPEMDAKSIPHKILPSLGLGRRDTQYPLLNTQVAEVVVRQQNDIIVQSIFKLMASISPFAFEMVTVDILEVALKGRGVQTPRTGDGGIDGVIYCPEPYNQNFLIQCKQYSSPVSVTEIDDFILDSEIWSEENYVEVESVFVALNGYTQSARDRGEDLGITMLTGHDLANMALKNERCIEKVDFPLLNQKYWEELSGVR